MEVQLSARKEKEGCLGGLSDGGARVQYEKWLRNWEKNEEEFLRRKGLDLSIWGVGRMWRVWS